MTSTTHMMAGLYIVSVVPNPLISFPVAFASHFVLDAIPHNDYFYFHIGKSRYMQTTPLSIITLIIGFSLIAFFSLSSVQPLSLLVGGVLGISPDIITGSTKLMGLNHTWFNRFHTFIHTDFDLGEFLYNLRGDKVIHITDENIPVWKENFFKLRKTLTANFGWFLESLFEILFLSLIISKLL